MQLRPAELLFWKGLLLRGVGQPSQEVSFPSSMACSLRATEIALFRSCSSSLSPSTAKKGFPTTTPMQSGTGTTAALIIEKIAHEHSSFIFAYDLASHAGFGRQVSTAEGNNRSNVIELQTRAGAGLSLVGRLSEDGTSSDTKGNAVVTAYNTLSGLAAMAPALAYLPKAKASNRLVLHVPTITPTSASLELSPTLAPLAPAIDLLTVSVAVILSSSPQESIDIASLAYSVTDYHVAHIFDYYGAAREYGHDFGIPHSISKKPLPIALGDAGYSFFDYHGDANATDVLVVLNGVIGASIRAITNRWSSLGVLVVRVLRPWDDRRFLDALPASTKTLHVVDEVPTQGAQGVLYADVFSACLDSFGPTVRQHRFTPSVTQELIHSPTSSASYIEELSPTVKSQSWTDGRPSKKILFVGSQKSRVASLPHDIVSSFSPSKSIDARLLDNTDVFASQSGLSYSRAVLYPSQRKDYVPFNVLLPLPSADAHTSEDEQADFLCVLDQNTLKTHAIFQQLKPGASVLLFTSWAASELANTLPSDSLSLAVSNGLHVYKIGTEVLEGDDNAASAIAYLAFMRLYLGGAATEEVLRSVAASVLVGLKGEELAKLNARAWSALEEVVPTLPSPSDVPATDLKRFEFNAVRNDIRTELESSLPGAHLSSWHDAARHIIFPEVYTPPSNASGTEEYPVNPSLRPEVPDHTFLVTCSVNRRLTPIEYDRNVFHLEFDTSGTGLKYAIGEALGVHGWNDADEVLDFCQWYGVNPDRLITIPVPSSDDGKVHTRTVFQALQQQVDIFGHPPKSFYADLSYHATRKEDKLSLQFIGAAEGSATYKKLSEKDTVTFADVLLKYASARPSIELLCEMIGDIKPRHYSIASAQSVVGDRVDLLVVTVEWATPSGKKSCTIELSSLLTLAYYRFATLWSMYAIPCWLKSGAKSNSFDQAQCDEGNSEECSIS